MQIYKIKNTRLKLESRIFHLHKIFYSAKTLLPDQEQSPVITSFYYPTADFNFKDFYQKLKAKGFVIYPGKISQADTFRIGNIGDVFPTDFERLIEAVKELQLQ